MFISLFKQAHVFFLPPGTSVFQVTATDADDPTYGNSARVVYSVLHGQPYFSVDPKTGKFFIIQCKQCLLIQCERLLVRLSSRRTIKDNMQEISRSFSLLLFILETEVSFWGNRCERYNTPPAPFAVKKWSLTCRAVLFGSWLYNGEHPLRMRLREHCVKGFQRDSGKEKKIQSAPRWICRSLRVTIVWALLQETIKC